MIWRDLRLRVRALLTPRRVERELDDELTFHLEMETRKHLAAGCGPAEARARARAHFGSAAVAAEACRDARRITFIDTCLQDARYAIRGFRRTPTVALTIVGTVALGLALVAAAFTIFNHFVLRVDAVRDASALVTVERPRSANGNRVRFTRPEYEALRRETSVFTDACAVLPDITSRIDGRMMEGHLVSGNYFEVLGVGAAHGRTLMPGDEAQAGRAVVVLSHSGWSRLFGGDPAVLGRLVLINGSRYEIVGVTPAGFRGLSFAAPDYWAPLLLAAHFRPWLAGREERLGIDIIGRLKPGISMRTARAGLAVWAAAGAASPGAASIRLEPRSTAIPLSAGVLLGFAPLFVAFGLILMIGCANVANLLLARAFARQREIGIRLALGASRGRIVRQLLTEGLLLALASAACALALSRVLLVATTSAVMRTMPPELAELVSLAAPAADWRVALFLVVAASVSTGLFALVPALRATRVDLKDIASFASRGGSRFSLSRTASFGSASRARNVLIVVQVTASALLLICAAVFLRSAWRASTVDPGLRTADTLMVEINNEPFRMAMVTAVTAEPSVRAVAASWPEPLSPPRVGFAGSAQAGAKASAATVAYRFVSPNYFSVLDIAVLRGRVFTPAEVSSNAAVAMVSDAIARDVWPGVDAVGQVLRLEPDPSSETRREDEPPLPSQVVVVVGVVRDVAGFRFAGYAEAGVYLPTRAENAETGLLARVDGDPELARRALLQRLTTIDPNMGMVITMRTLGRMATYPLRVAFWLTVVLGGLALLLTVSGIFSVVSYLVEQRRKEIGVRLALGATPGNVARLVLRQSLEVVGVGVACGGGLAWLLATILMTTPAASRIGGIVRVFDPPAYAVSLLCIVTTCALAAALPALRAARIDPIATLRQD